MKFVKKLSKAENFLFFLAFYREGILLTALRAIIRYVDYADASVVSPE